jgi:hypothetical protein
LVDPSKFNQENKVFGVPSKSSKVLCSKCEYAKAKYDPDDYCIHCDGRSNFKEKEFADDNITKVEESYKDTDINNNKVKCPFCRMNIDKEAVKCPFCQEWVDNNENKPKGLSTEIIFENGHYIKICPYCGLRNKKEDLFCFSCKMPI